MCIESRFTHAVKESRVYARKSTRREHKSTCRQNQNLDTSIEDKQRAVLMMRAVHQRAFSHAHADEERPTGGHVRSQTTGSSLPGHKTKTTVLFS